MGLFNRGNRGLQADVGFNHKASLNRRIARAQRVIEALERAVPEEKKVKLRKELNTLRDGLRDEQAAIEELLATEGS